ncbi:MAG: 3-phosphoshikimate 1-carboxyvinyltransferase [Pseudomonadota bacterium]
MTAGYRVTPVEKVSGRLRVPGDKSISHRSLMLGGIATGITEVSGFLSSADCLATMAALQSMGVQVEQRTPTDLRVHGRGVTGLRAPQHDLDMGNAGTAIRLFMGLLSGQRFATTLTGDDSLRRRPMERVARPLRLMGAQIATHDGKPPVRITPAVRLAAIDYDLPVASAQVKSAILLAGLRAEGTTMVSEPAPTRDHTEQMLQSFGVELRREKGRVWLRGGQSLQAAPVAVPGDFSSAAFFIVAGCLAGADDYVIENVGVNPTRTGLIDILRLMGADIRLHLRSGAGSEPVADIKVRAAQLHGIRVPEALVPLAIDEFPVLFIAAVAASGETVVTGAEELRVKESDRLAVMAEGLGALGIATQLTADGITIQGGARFRPGRIDSHGDHRIAMAFAMASLRADGPIEISDVLNVGTSFPGFAETARRAGLALESA